MGLGVLTLLHSNLDRPFINQALSSILDEDIVQVAEKSHSRSLHPNRFSKRLIGLSVS